MTMKYQSLGESLQELLVADAEVIVLARTPEGFKELKAGTLQEFINSPLVPRIENLEDNPLTSTWPVARKLSLAGPFTGEVMLDGRQDEVLTVTVPTGALPSSAINGLPTTLLALNTDVSNHESRLDAAEAALPTKLDATANAVSASKWQTARTLSLIGKAAGSVSFDGSGNFDLNVTSLTVAKADVGLGNVDNTSDLNKPISTATQTAIDGRVAATAENENATSLPSVYANNAVTTGALTANHPGPGGIGAHITARSNSDNRVGQFAFSNHGGTTIPDLWFRTHHTTDGGGGWTGYQKLWHGGNFDPTDKADLNSSPIFTGSVTAQGGSLYVNAASAAGNSHLWLRNETGVNQGVIYWDRTSDTVRIRRYNTDGAGIEGELSVGATSASYNGYNLWHANNFDPTTKLDATATAAAATKLANSRNFSLTGVVTAAAVGFDGSGNVALATAIADNALLIAKTSGLQAALDGKSATSHNHDTVYVKIPNASGSADPNTIGQTLSHTVMGAAAGNGPAAYTTIWNLGATSNRDGQFAWVYGSGSEDLYFRSRHDVSGTWNSWNRVWHSGDFAIAEASTVSTVAKRNSSGDLQVRLLRAEYNDEAAMSGAIAYRVNNSTNNYTRYCNSPAAVRGWLGLNTDDVVAFARVSAGHDSGQPNSVGCSNWFRSSGNTGWYNTDWGGGIYMTDATYVRTYANKQMAAADFVISSDERLKAHVRPFEFRGRLRPVMYWHKEAKRLDMGFIAQEVQQLYPEIVGVYGESGYLNLSYPRITAILSDQVNKVEDRTIALEAERDNMRSELDLLRSQVDQLLNPWWKRLLKRLFRRQ